MRREQAKRDQQFDEQLDGVLLGRPSLDGPPAEASEVVAAQFLARGLAPLRVVAPAARERTWQEVQTRIAARPVPALRPSRLPLSGASWQLRAAVLTLLALSLGALIWRSAPAWAQLGSGDCFMRPGVDPACAAGLTLARAGSAIATRGGATLAAHATLATGGDLLIRIELTGQLPGKVNDVNRMVDTVWLSPTRREGHPRLWKELQISVRDAQGRLFTPGPHSADLLSPDGVAIQAITADGRFAGLAPNASAIELLVHGPSPVGDWSLRVPLTPMPAAGGEGVAIHGIRIAAASVAANAQRTAIQLAVYDTPERRVLGLGGQQLPGSPTLRPGHLLLEDEQGHAHDELLLFPRQQMRMGNVLPDAALFPALPPGSPAATLVVPFVVVNEQTGEAGITVPVAGKRVGDRIPLDAMLTLGPDTFRVTGAEIFQEPGSGQPQLQLHMDLGDWHAGRKLIGPQIATVNGVRPAHWAAPHALGDVGQYDAEYTPLPTGATAVTITFRGAQVALRGPWQVPVSLPTSR